jgi:hypothetical protein
VHVHYEGGTANTTPSKATAHELDQDQNVYSNADAVVRVRQVSRRTDGKEAKNEDDSRETNGKNLQVGVVANGAPRPTCVEPRQQHGDGNDEEEGHYGEYAMAKDQRVVLCQG